MVNIIKHNLLKVLYITSLIIAINTIKVQAEETSDIEDIIKIEKVENKVDTSNTKKCAIQESVVTDIAEVLGMDVDEDNIYSLVFGEELASFDIIVASEDSEEELNNRFKNYTELEVENLSNLSMVKIPTNDELNKHQEKIDEQNRKQRRRKVVLEAMQVDTLLSIDEPDENYKGNIVKISDEDRYILERLVMGEAGGEGKEGAALVAQAIRDTMIYKGFNSVEEVRQALKYSGSLNREPNQDVKDAVAFIFDQGGCAVKHRIFYFYAHNKITSEFHESQHFVIEYKGHRFFSTH